MSSHGASGYPASLLQCLHPQPTRTTPRGGNGLHLIDPLAFSPAHRRVRRAGLDYWPRVCPCTWPAWEVFESHLPELGEPLFFSAEAERDLWSVDWPERPVLVFGTEDRGLPAEIRERHRESLVRIPILDPGVRSLNLSTAVAVGLYEDRRRRG